MATYVNEPGIQAKVGHAFDLGQGARLEVGVVFDELEALRYERSVGRVSALLEAENGYAPANTLEWIANLNPQVVLLSVSARDGEGRPSAETLAALQGYTLLRTDRNDWIMSRDSAYAVKQISSVIERYRKNLNKS